MKRLLTAAASVQNVDSEQHVVIELCEGNKNEEILEWLQICSSQNALLEQLLLLYLERDACEIIMKTDSVG